VSAGGNSPILQNSYSLPPYGNSDSVVAFDPEANGLYSASASSSVNVLSAYNGTLSLSGQTSGGTADPYLVDDAESIANIFWFDQLVVGGLAPGKPITLEITDQIDGHLSFQPSNPEGASRLYHGIQISTPYTSSQFDYDLSPNTNYIASGSITSTHKYRFKTYSGAVLSLANILESDLNGGGQWTYSAEVDAARIYVDVLTLGGQVISQSGLDYSTPNSQLVVPSVLSESEATAVANLAASGLSVGTIAAESNSTIASGLVVSEVPAVGTAVPALFPVNLVVSSGPAAKPCSADASSLVTVALSGYKYNASLNLYEPTATITNISASTIKAPINLIVENLSGDAVLQNAVGMTTCNAPGSPYLASDHPLTAGGSVKFPVHFTDPTQQPITWTADVTAQGTP
jgi:hypothetical protein